MWYSQEARAYALLVLLAAVAMLCFLRAERRPTPRHMAAFAVAGGLALLTHYFAVFLVVPMALWLVRDRGRVRAAAPALALVSAVAIALVPLAATQKGHTLGWIGAWALSSRLATIPQYYLTGNSGASLGHGIELLVALLIAAGVGYGVWRGVTARERDGALLASALAACGVLIPVAGALVGLDYLAPRNVIAAMIPVTAAIAVLVTAQRTGRAGMVLAGLIGVAFAALSVDVSLSPRLQRSDWRGVARVLAGEPHRAARVITTVELGAAPLEYYLPPLHNLFSGQTVRVREIDETGYPPLRPGAGEPPAPGFRLRARVDVHGLVLFRFSSPIARTVSQATLRRHVITAALPEVLVAGPPG